MRTRRDIGAAARAACLAPAVALALAACGGSSTTEPAARTADGAGSVASEPAAGESSTGAGQTGGTADSGSAGGAQSRAPDVAAADDGDANVIGWILDLGVGAPTGPGAFRAYEALRRQDCRAAHEIAVAEGQRVVEAASIACLAATSGDSGLWDQAGDRYRDLAGADLTCLDVAVYGLAGRLLEAHERDPDRAFRFATDGVAGTPPCPRVSDVTPSTGRVGDVLTITGTNLQYVTEVRVGQTSVDVATDREDVLRVTVPDPSQAGAVDGEPVSVVVVAAPSQWEIGRRDFTYSGSVDDTLVESGEPEDAEPTDAEPTDAEPTDGESDDPQEDDAAGEDSAPADAP